MKRIKIVYIFFVHYISEPCAGNKRKMAVEFRRIKSQKDQNWKQNSIDTRKMKQSSICN